jgi:hypothetical protein
MKASRIVSPRIHPVDGITKKGSRPWSIHLTFRLIGSAEIWDGVAALTSRLQSLETEMLSEEGNFSEPAGLNRALIGRAEAMDSGYRTILGLDFAEIHV